MNYRSLLLFGLSLALSGVCRAEESDVIAALESAGATVQRDLSAKSKPVLVVRYNLRQVTEAGNQALKELEEIPAIEFLGSGDTELTAATLDALRGKESLKRLSVAYAKIGDESVKVLRNLRSLEVLELLSQVDMTPQSLQEILKLKHLKELTISDRLVSDTVIETLCEINHLKALSIRSMYVSDTMIFNLCQMTSLSTLRIVTADRVSLEGLRLLSSMRLKHLDVTYFAATEAGLKELRKAENLERLKLVDARKINDESVPVLSEMTDLKDLEIVGARFTKSGLKELKESLSKCKITLVDF